MSLASSWGPKDLVIFAIQRPSLLLLMMLFAGLLCDSLYCELYLDRTLCTCVCFGTYFFVDIGSFTSFGDCDLKWL